MPTLVTTADEISVLGFDSTPEIEFVLFRTMGFDYVTVGSDHTDRKVETQSVVLSKNLCPKPVARTAWPVTQVLPHWDRPGLMAPCDGETHQAGGIPANLQTEDTPAGTETGKEGEERRR